MPNGKDLRKRYKLKIRSWYRYPDEDKWNVSIDVYDSKHAVDPGTDPIGNFDFDFDGNMDDARNIINVKLWRHLDEKTDNVLVGIKQILSEYGK